MCTNDLPNLFLIGANKAGTTALVDALRSDERIFIPPVKEPHFFSRSSRNGKPKGLFPIETISNIVAYKKLYKSTKREVFRLDASTDYLYNAKHVIDEFHNLGIRKDHIKIVAIVREPASRLWSHYIANVKDGAENLTFLDAIEMETIKGRLQRGWWCGYDYIGCGMYAHRLQQFKTAGFDVHIIKFENLIPDANTELTRLYDFLGLREPRDIVFPKSNPSGIPQNRSINKIGICLRRSTWLRALNKRLTDHGINFHARLLRWFLDRKLQRVKLPEKYREQVEALYDDEVIRLADQFGIDYKRVS